MQPVGDRVDHHFFGVGEALAVGELLAIVEHVELEADRAGKLRELVADVSGADDVEMRGGLQRLDVDLHVAAADEAGLLREIIGEIVL